MVEQSVVSLAPLSAPPDLQDTARLDALIQARENTQISLKCRRLAGEALEILDLPPVLHEIGKLEEAARSLEHTEYAHNRATATTKALDPVISPPQIKDTAPLETLIEHLTACAESYDLSSSSEGTLEELLEPPELYPLRLLEEHAASLQQVQRLLQDTYSLGGILAALAPCAEPQPIADGDELLGHMKHLYSQLDANALLQEQLASVIAEKRQEIGQVIQGLGLCPLCGHTLDMDHFLEATHG
jgi:hypothetical protein